MDFALFSVLSKDLTCGAIERCFVRFILLELGGIGSKALQDFFIDSRDLKLQFEQTVHTLRELNPIGIVILKIINGLQV